jgi:hypothetical protein
MRLTRLRIGVAVAIAAGVTAGTLSVASATAAPAKPDLGPVPTSDLGTFLTNADGTPNLANQRHVGVDPNADPLTKSLARNGYIDLTTIVPGGPVPDAPGQTYNSTHRAK